MAQPEAKENLRASVFQHHSKWYLGKLDYELKNIQNLKSSQESRLHEYQIRALMSVREFYFPSPGNIGKNNHKAALVVAPTGTGKSGMLTFLPFILESQKTLILTPSHIISSQIYSAFAHKKLTERFLVKSGLLQATDTKAIKNRAPSILMPSSTEDIEKCGIHELTITNAQKFGGKSRSSLNPYHNPDSEEIKECLNEFDTIIVDEAHHCQAETWKNILDLFRGKKIVLLTATPYTGSLENAKKISIPGLETVYHIEKKDVEGTTTRSLQFDERTMGHIHFSSEYFDQLASDIRSIFKKHQELEPRFENKQQGMLMVKDTKECKTAAEELEKRGIRAIAITSETGKNVEEFESNNKQVAVVCQMMMEGYDNSNITLCAVLRNCQTPARFDQFVGRATRIHRLLNGKAKDRTIATVLTYTMYNQKRIWEARELIASQDYCYNSDDEGKTSRKCDSSDFARLIKSRLPRATQRTNGIRKNVACKSPKVHAEEEHQKIMMLKKLVEKRKMDTQVCGQSKIFKTEPSIIRHNHLSNPIPPKFSISPNIPLLGKETANNSNFLKKVRLLPQIEIKPINLNEGINGKMEIRPTVAKAWASTTVQPMNNLRLTKPITIPYQLPRGEINSTPQHGRPTQGLFFHKRNNLESIISERLRIPVAASSLKIENPIIGFNVPK